VTLDLYDRAAQDEVGDPRARFDMYGQPPPEGDWRYVIDDSGISYGPGWWPLYRTWLGSAGLQPAGVRLAPDSEFRSWRNEYVLIGPGSGPVMVAHLNLYVREQGMGAIVVEHVAVTLDIRNRAATVDEGCPGIVLEQAQGKAGRLLAWLLAERAARRSGRARPVTAADLEEARKTPR
jgi:hypothetical protein